VLLVTLITGLWVRVRASQDSASYFLGSRSMPWWLLGTSMVATTFATDTPNLVTGLVREHGVAGNWVWWCFLVTGMLTGFVYAKLWRRLGVATDIEFYEIRYSGRPAAFLRGFRAVYIGIFFNVMIIATVTLALVKYANVLFGTSPVIIVLVAGVVTVVFSAAGGLLGVLFTDLILFVISMCGAVMVAYFAVNHPDVGGLASLLANPDLQPKRAFLPDLSDPDQYVPLLLMPLLVQWWSAWYPGSEPGGGGYVAQRMLAAKDERHAAAATVFFNFAHYALRPWPWILVALASLVVFPDLASIKVALPHVADELIDNDLAYPAMLTFLPPGFMGIVVASIVAAYVSTISTSLNLGASYVVNDIYVRFISPRASEGRRVLVGRMLTVLLMVLAGLLALVLESAVQGFQLLLSVGAGTGLLFFLRWFWRRINAWSEIAAMVISFAVSLYLHLWAPQQFELWQRFALTVGVTTAGWMLVALVTPATSPDTLRSFERRIAAKSDAGAGIGRGVVMALIATAGVYSLMFGTGLALYGQGTTAALAVFAGIMALLTCLRYFKRV
jgi:solute:Na+ symporter, SSS family